MHVLRDEQLCTQRCLDICAQLLQHIDQIQVIPRADFPGQDASPEDVTNEGLRGCTDYLSATTEKLEKHMQSLINRMIAKSEAASASKEQVSVLIRLRDEWQTARQCRAVCALADKRLKDNVTTIDNYATGDALQFMVSTDGKVIHGRNRGYGPITRQVGGHLSDASLQQLSRDIASLGFRKTASDNPAPSDDPPRDERGKDDDPTAAFQSRYGPGSVLETANTSPTSGSRPLSTNRREHPQDQSSFHKTPTR